MPTLEATIQCLMQFWQQQGCIVHHGYDLELGAASFNPVTFLRCLGPEPYRAAYVEPCRRPQDGRYAKNPNRLQLFHQFQVILKPSPLDVQKLYLQSLQAIGLDLQQHDVRFVHDDWESPTLGASGLGWEVWIDGMEVTQFTYLQMMGSLPLHPIPVELSYGLERLCMYLQDVESVFDVYYAPQLRLAELSKHAEAEWSTYNFRAATCAMWQQHFDGCEAEANQLLAQNLPIAAYDFVVKSSHAFNLLDARGAIAVPERVTRIARIRNLAKRVATQFLAQRRAAGFPLQAKWPQQPASSDSAQTPPPTTLNSADFLLEIGSEELPAAFAAVGMDSLQREMEQLLQQKQIGWQQMIPFATPRRLGIFIAALDKHKQPKRCRKGPAAAIAFDQQGQLTQQGAGFLRQLQIALTPQRSSIERGECPPLEIRMVDRQPYLCAWQAEDVPLGALLQAALPKILAAIAFPKKMSWHTYQARYARPIHWICALLGDQLIPFHFAGVKATATTRSHRQRGDRQLPLSNASAYFITLRQHGVLADPQQRLATLRQQLQAIAAHAAAQPVASERVLQEVLYLSEWPQLVVGHFPAPFLELPRELLICQMTNQQRCFPLQDRHGQLLAQFIMTVDNVPHRNIRRGNEKVLAARLADGRFLYQQDLATPLATFTAKLQAMTWQKGCGTLWDKVVRLQREVALVAAHLPNADLATAQQAATLCKSDLATALVAEFPELQGIIGRQYALQQGTPAAVATAIAEHWMPQGEGAPLPASSGGALLSLTDKLDSLLVHANSGITISAAADPYALRRQAVAVIRILLAANVPLSLRQLLTDIATVVHCQQQTIDTVQQLLMQRAKSIFAAGGFSRQETRAIVTPACDDPVSAQQKLVALQAFRQQQAPFAQLLEVYKRSKGIVAKAPSTHLQRALLQEPAERALIARLDALSREWQEHLAARAYDKIFSAMAALRPALASLFAEVRILDAPQEMRQNRIALLDRTLSLLEQMLDLSAF